MQSNHFLCLEFMVSKKLYISKEWMEASLSCQQEQGFSFTENKTRSYLVGGGQVHKYCHSLLDGI